MYATTVNLGASDALALVLLSLVMDRVGSFAASHAIGLIFHGVEGMKESHLPVAYLRINVLDFTFLYSFQ